MSTVDKHAEPTQDVLLARQPVFDVDRTIHGFELFFRTPGQDTAVGAGHGATASVVLNALVTIGIDNLSSGELLFINCTRDDLFAPLLFPAERAVLEVQQSVELDAAAIERLRELRQSGYRIALDNFVLDESKRAALDEADYVKLDLRQLSAAQLRETVAALRQFPARIIGARVESETELQHCHRLGIDLFQGYFLRKPDIVHRKSVPTSRLAALQLVAECEKPNVTIQQVAAIISRDVALAWGLLRLANTLLYAGAAPVETLTQAVARLGLQKVTRWALLLTLAGQENCPNGYLQLSLQRAWMCEKIAHDQQMESPESCFLVGLLSLLDSIVEVPMSVLVRQLPVSQKIRAALVDREGVKGNILNAVLAWERADWQSFRATGVSAAHAREAWLLSLEKSSEALRSLHEAGKADAMPA